jgi:uncharacterized flavoprotein (TIGR03862 family)
LIQGPAQVAIIGGGPAGLMTAEVLSVHADPSSIEITVYDRMPAVGRKLLMAGRGGLNLTHSEDFPRFLKRYGVRENMLRPALEALPPPAIRAWCEGLGQPTFVGSSGRVFPRAMKTSPLLRAWLARLAAHSVVFKTRHLWHGWDDQGLLQFATATGSLTVRADATVLALGGASWPRLGSDARWIEPLQAAGVKLVPFEPANGGFLIGWSKIFRDRFEGQPLKRVAIRWNEHTVRGEAILTDNGIEGGAIYALSPLLRKAVAMAGQADITIDLRPDIRVDDLAALLATPRKKQSLSSFLRKTAKLSPAAIGLMQETALGSQQRLADAQPDALARRIKAVPLRLTATAPIDHAISTAGGVSFDAIDSDFMLVTRPGVFVAGEMLDWEAPTGGYLLQACFATGAAVGRGVRRWIAKTRANGNADQT